MQFSFYAGLLLLSCLVSLALGGYVSSRLFDPVVRSFFYLMIGIFCWSFSFLLEAVSTSLVFKLFWAVISVIDLIVPVLFLYFVLQFTRSGDRFPPVAFFALLIIPCISFFLSATFPLHGLVWPEIYLVKTIFAGFSLFYLHGAWYWVEVFYGFLLYFVAAWMLLRNALRSPPVYAAQMWLVFAGSLFPFISTVLYAFASPHFVGIDCTPFSFILTGIVLFYAITRHSLFDLIPIAHAQIVQDMQEGVIVLDKDDRIVEVNPVVQDLLPITDQMIGEHYSILSPYLADCVKEGTDCTISGNGIVKVADRWIEFRVYPINPEKNPVKAEGKLILCIDVTELMNAKQELCSRNDQLEKEVLERMNAEKSLQHANKKLSLLSSITRHDILNAVTVVNGYTRILLDSGSDKNTDSLERIAEAGDKIVEIISFTGVYEEMGTRIPRWIPMEKVFDEADITALLQKITFSLENRNLQVFADLMFSRVFYNLLDNTIRHGSGATSVRISGFCDGNGYCLVYEDNGTGIPDEEKEIVFRQGHGKNTGLGLFLIREILDITGIRIRECGEFGKGVRFEILIPEGGFRFGTT